MEIYTYDERAKLRISTTLTTPDSNNIKIMLIDTIKNYMFAGAYDSGSIYIY